MMYSTLMDLFRLAHKHPAIFCVSVVMGLLVGVALYQVYIRFLSRY